MTSWTEKPLTSVLSFSRENQKSVLQMLYLFSRLWMKIVKIIDWFKINYSLPWKLRMKDFPRPVIRIRSNRRLNFSGHPHSWWIVNTLRDRARLLHQELLIMHNCNEGDTRRKARTGLKASDTIYQCTYSIYPYARLHREPICSLLTPYPYYPTSLLITMVPSCHRQNISMIIPIAAENSPTTRPHNPSIQVWAQQLRLEPPQLDRAQSHKIKTSKPSLITVICSIPSPSLHPIHPYRLVHRWCRPSYPVRHWVLYYRWSYCASIDLSYVKTNQISILYIICVYAKRMIWFIQRPEKRISPLRPYDNLLSPIISNAFSSAFCLPSVT